MKLNIVSDLHLDVSGYQELPGGEILILSGDIAEVRNIRNHFHSTKIVSDLPNHEYACSEFFHYECAKYDRVFYVMGNHEHYKSVYQNTRRDLEYMMPKNLTILENDVVDYNGIMFIGATLWTDLNRGDPLTEYHVKQCLNDYKHIKQKGDAYDLYHKLKPSFTIAEHRRSLDYFRIVLEQNKDRKFVVITHHAPSFESVNNYYKHDTLMNGGYMSRLEEFILDHPNICLWTHGHMHNKSDYLIGDTRVVCNPRGYLPYEEDNEFNPGFIVEI
jgi:Icc-related predicted phosphoesterase